MLFVKMIFSLLLDVLRCCLKAEILSRLADYSCSHLFKSSEPSINHPVNFCSKYSIKNGYSELVILMRSLSRILIASKINYLGHHGPELIATV